MKFMSSAGPAAAAATACFCSAAAAPAAAAVSPAAACAAAEPAASSGRAGAAVWCLHFAAVASAPAGAAAGRAQPCGGSTSAGAPAGAPAGGPAAGGVTGSRGSGSGSTWCGCLGSTHPAAVGQVPAATLPAAAHAGGGTPLCASHPAVCADQPAGKSTAGLPAAVKHSGGSCGSRKQQPPRRQAGGWGRRRQREAVRRPDLPHHALHLHGPRHLRSESAMAVRVYGLGFAIYLQPDCCCAPAMWHCASCHSQLRDLQ